MQGCRVKPGMTGNSHINPATARSSLKFRPGTLKSRRAQSERPIGARRGSPKAQTSDFHTACGWRFLRTAPTRWLLPKPRHPLSTHSPTDGTVLSTRPRHLRNAFKVVFLRQSGDMQVALATQAREFFQPLAHHCLFFQQFILPGRAGPVRLRTALKLRFLRLFAVMRQHRKPYPTIRPSSA